MPAREGSGGVAGVAVLVEVTKSSRRKAECGGIPCSIASSGSGKQMV